MKRSPTGPEQLFEVPAADTASLERLFRTQFLDISKVIALFDQKRASEFKNVNGAFMIEHNKKKHFNLFGNGIN